MQSLPTYVYVYRIIYLRIMRPHPSLPINVTHISQTFNDVKQKNLNAKPNSKQKYKRREWLAIVNDIKIVAENTIHVRAYF